MRISVLCCFLGLMWPMPAMLAQKQATTAQVEALLRQTAQAPELRHASLGFCAMPTATGKPLLAWNEHTALAPASVLKLATTGAALLTLGGGHRFETVLEYGGTLGRDGVLNGNCYIRGGGDPSLGADSEQLNALLDQWAAAVQKAGVKKINGAVVADESFFDEHNTPDAWYWNDLGNYYGAGANGLNMRANTYELVFAPRKKQGEATRIVRTEPPALGITWVNEVRCGPPASGDQAYIYGAPYTYLRHVRGTIPPGGGEFRIKGSLPDPALLCAQLLHNKLKAKGITIAKPPTSLRLLRQQGKVPTGARRKFHSTFSPPLRELVAATNLRSINLYAECMARLLGKKRFGQGSLAKGLDAIRECWEQRGVPLAGALLHDGSGLSRSNALSPHQMAALLCAMAKQSAFTDFYQSLPVAGQSGTAKFFGRNTLAQGNARVKSGSILGVKCYAGYVRTRSGKLMAFCAMANNYLGTDELMTQRLEKWVAHLAALP